jgi:homogentisate phytyltransferase/homogentisate geranylgeranyltransferase
MQWLYNFWKFSRPHTIIGTSLSIFALYSIALVNTNSPVTGANFIQMLGAWLACLSGNIYIVGLNQLTDIAIDRVNKPQLPLASGEFSQKQGQYIVAVAGILALILGGYFGIWLFATVAISLLIGTAYSLPPIRLKRFPFLAALCILTVRGMIVNLGLFLHFTKKLSGTALLTPSVWTLSLFILVFTIAIAIFKDVPDMEGDRKYKISTFTLLLGKLAVFNFVRWTITICYLGMILGAIFWLPFINLQFFIIAHLLLLTLLWWRSHKVNLESNISITNFYQFIWKLFFLEYLIFPASHYL